MKADAAYGHGLPDSSGQDSPPAGAAAPDHGTGQSAGARAAACEIDHDELEAALGRWLGPGPSGRPRRHFPRALERLYAQETTPIKLMALHRSSLAGQVAVILLTPVLWHIVADQRTLFLLVWGGALAPASLGSFLVLHTAVPTKVKTGFMLASGLVDALCISVLTVCSVHIDPSAYLGGMLLLVLLNAIEGSFDPRLATGLVMILTVVFGATVASIPAMQASNAALLFILFSACAFFAVSGCWRLEMEARRSFALMLRERLQQTTLKRLNGELHDLARRDPLTGLANRRAHDEWLQAAWRQAIRSGAPLALVILDIDQFKAYNDFYGHAAGDACLQTIARCLSDHARGSTDCLSRLGGEEFAALLPRAGLDAAGDVAERLRLAVHALQLPHLGCGIARTVTISCGAASLQPRARTTPDTLFTMADTALYAAKQGGRNRVCLASADPAQAPEAGLAATPDPTGPAFVPGPQTGGQALS